MKYIAVKLSKPGQKAPARWIVAEKREMMGYYSSVTGPLLESTARRLLNDLVYLGMDRLPLESRELLHYELQ